MSEAVPIRKGVEPRFDAEREIIDYCALKVREFAASHKAPATRVVLCLMGRTGSDEQTFTTHSWDSKGSRTESEMCGHAMALLAKKMSR